MKDLVDHLIEDWKREKPDYEVGGMAVVGRAIQLGRILEARVEELLKPLGLIYTDFDILATLRRSGLDFTLTPTELRNSVLLTSGAMTAALDRLQRAELIRRVRASKDRRSMSAQLTDKGVALAEKAAKLRFSDASRVIAPLTHDQREEAANCLKRLIRATEVNSCDSSSSASALAATGTQAD